MGSDDIVDGSVPTRREMGRNAAGLPTRRESPSATDVGAPTRREGDHATGRPTGAFSIVNLPPELSADYRVVRDLDSGSEANVVLAVDRNDVQVVIKLYRAGLEFDGDASALLEAASGEHVVRIVKMGRREHNGARFEVLEWCQHESLRHVLRSGVELDLVEVVRELTDAIEHIHGLRMRDKPDVRLIHRDIKPENVFVRTLEPDLDLVLGDFGLARAINASRHFTKLNEGSQAYAPTSGEAVSQGRDWWALGMLIAEIAAGRHPFQVGDMWLEPEVIADRLAAGPVDLSGVSDARVVVLCRGLLLRNSADRWGAAEVRRWLAGEEVPVAADAAVARPKRTVVFRGEAHDHPRDLALAMQQDWKAAQELAIQGADGGAFAEQLRLLLSAHGIADADKLTGTGRNAPARLALLLREMASDLPPIYRGRDVRPEAIAHRLQQRASMKGEVEFIEDGKLGLLTAGVLEIWRDLEGMDEAAAAHASLIAARKLVDTRRGSVKGLEQPELRAQLYQIALRPGAVDVDARLAALDRTAVHGVGWWEELARSSDRLDRALAHVTYRDAVAETNMREESERSEVRRRELEREAAAEARQQELFAARRGVTVTSWRRWWFPMAFLGGLATWLGVGTIVCSYAGREPYAMLDWPFGAGWVGAITWRIPIGQLDDDRSVLSWLPPENGLVTQLVVGIALCAVAFVLFVLALVARRGWWIGPTGELRVTPSFLRGLATVATVAYAAYQPVWAMAGMIGLAVVIGAIIGLVIAVMIGIAIAAT